MTDAWHRFIKNVELRRFVVLLLIIFVLWMMRSMMNMILFTFILTFIVVSWIRFVQRWWPRVAVKPLVILTYLVLLLLLYFGVTKYLPVLVHQVVKMVNSVIKFYSSKDATILYHYINHYVSWSTIMAQVRHGVSFAISALTSIGAITVTFVLSLILSFFFALDLRETATFSKLFLNSTLTGSSRTWPTLARSLSIPLGLSSRPSSSSPSATPSSRRSACSSWRCRRSWPWRWWSSSSVWFRWLG